MKINAVKTITFGERNQWGSVVVDKMTGKRSLITGKPIAKSQVLDDVFEFCTELKNKNNKKRITSREKTEILASANPIEKLINVLNSKV